MRNLLTIGLLLLAIGFSQSAVAQEMPELDKSPMDMAYYPARAAFRSFEKDAAKKAEMEPVMRIIYSRPQANGREVMGNLVKKGEMWRLGANENTELNVFQEATIGDATLEPGRYSLHAIPGDDSWTLVVNSDVDAWGSYSYDQSKDVARIEGEVSKTDQMVEAFTVMFTEDQLIMAWENTQIAFPVSK